MRSTKILSLLPLASGLELIDYASIILADGAMTPESYNNTLASVALGTPAISASQNALTNLKDSSSRFYSSSEAV